MGVEAFGTLTTVDVGGVGFFAAQVAALAAAALGVAADPPRPARTAGPAGGPHPRADRTGGRTGPGDLHPVELAYVTGGADHAVLVAYLGLRQRGDLVPAPARQPVAATDGDPGGPPRRGRGRGRGDQRLGGARRRHHRDPSGRASGDRRGAQGSQVPGNLLGLRLSQAMGSLHQRLAAQGLIVDARLARHLRLAGLWVAPSLVVALGGVLRLPAGGQDTLAYFGCGLAAADAAGAGFWALEVPRTTPAGARRWSASSPTRSPDHARGTRLAAEAREPYRAPAAALGHDPRAVAALGPTLTWKVAPEVPAGFGFPPPKDPGTS